MPVIESPTPYSLNSNSWELGIHAYQDDPWIADFRIGVTPEFTLAVDAIEYDGAGLGMKYQLLKSKGNAPALAIGVDDIGRDHVSPYLVIGDTFPGSSFLRWDLGIGGGRYDGLFVGLNADLSKAGHAGPPIELKAELVDDDVNLGISFKFAPGWKLDVASADGDLLAGVTYRASF
jgi:hypothetical protein